MSASISDSQQETTITEIIKINANSNFYLTYKSTETWPNKRDDYCRILILDSSFNPPTRAHANLLHKSIQTYPPGHFDALLLLLSTKNADKQLTGATIVQRAQMMELMAARYPNSAVGLTPHAKFVDKAAHIQAWLPDVRLELYFIMGYDTIVRLLDPKYYMPRPMMEALGPFLNTCHIICADRGEGEEQKAFWNKLELGTCSIRRIQLDPAFATLSSTMARTKIMQGQSVLDVLDPDIAQFVQDHHIYSQ